MMKKTLALAILTFVAACGKSGGGSSHVDPNNPDYIPGNGSSGETVRFNVDRTYTFCENGSFTINPGTEVSREFVQTFFRNLERDSRNADGQMAMRYRNGVPIGYRPKWESPNQIAGISSAGRYHTGYDFDDSNYLSHNDR